MIGVMPGFCLEMHADYRCRHTGACCTAGWAIPAEPTVVRAVEARFHGAGARFVTSGASPDGAVFLATTAGGACVFFDETHGRLCAIHRELGPERLPSACRHFPRVVLTDERGTFVSLSHFCPTAATMLFTDRPLRRVIAPAWLTLDDGVEGLDARDVLPPLVRPGMLTDLEGYDAWERAGIDVLSRGDLSPEQGLSVIESATVDVETWRPGAAPLAVHVKRAFDAAPIPDARVTAFEDAARLKTRAREAVPPGVTLPAEVPNAESRWRIATEGMRPFDGVICRYLGSRLFGNWIAYCGSGLRTVVESLRVHLAVLRMEILRRVDAAANPRDVLLESIRATDLLLVHYAEPRALARLIDAAS